MAYADTLRSNSVQMNDIADLIDGLRVTYTLASDLTTRSTSSATYVDLVGTDISIATEDGDIVLLLGNFRFSNSTANQGGVFSPIIEGAGAPVPAGGIVYDSSTDGNRLTQGWFWIHAPSIPGIQTYKVMFATALGTCYVTNSQFAAMVFQNV